MSFKYFNPDPTKKWAPALILFCLISMVSLGCDNGQEDDGLQAVSALDSSPKYVSESTCADCHPEEVNAWTGSHHDLAMQDISDSVLKGAFDSKSFQLHGTKTSFVKKDDGFFVQIRSADGTLIEHEVSHVFGHEPLQQLIVPIGSGRSQAFSVAWDVEKEKWFHLMPNERIDTDDELHWTKPSQNWNFMCAECHATGLKRNYNVGTNGYRTTSHRLDVGCQACHGPASLHVEHEAELGVDLKKNSDIQIETCARCHSRRAPIGDGYDLTKSLHDDYRVSLLDEGLYHPDGQIYDEVYVYGSFVQSKMYHAGMRCSDCHDPHSGSLKLEGNDLCISCHNNTGPAAAEHISVSGLRKKDYNSPAHHFHSDLEQPSCVDCHAPQKTYMRIDPRRDHSFRIPRPDLSEELGTPNACNTCHENRSSAWASEKVREWYGDSIQNSGHYGIAINAGRNGASNAPQLLKDAIFDKGNPAIVRATALELLARFPGQSLLDAIRASIKDPDPMVRRAAVAAHVSVSNEEAAYLTSLLSDPIRSVRLEAIQFVDVRNPSPLTEEVVNEFIDAQNSIGGRGSGALNLGALRQRQGNIEEAERLYRQSIREEETFVPGWVNLADVVRYRSESEAEKILRKAIELVPDAGSLHYSLGLSLVRQKKIQMAREELAIAVRLEPTNAYYAEVLRMAKEN